MDDRRIQSRQQLCDLSEALEPFNKLTEKRYIPVDPTDTGAGLPGVLWVESLLAVGGGFNLGRLGLHHGHHCGHSVKRCRELPSILTQKIPYVATSDSKYNQNGGRDLH